MAKQKAPFGPANARLLANTHTVYAYYAVTWPGTYIHDLSKDRYVFLKWDPEFVGVIGTTVFTTTRRKPARVVRLVSTEYIKVKELPGDADMDLFEKVSVVSPPGILYSKGEPEEGHYYVGFNEHREPAV